MRLAALARRMAERAAASETLASAGRADSAAATESPAASRAAHAAPSSSLYGSEAYWDGRYAEASEAAVDESSRDEWYVGAEPVLALLAAHVPLSAAVGVLGCGLSALPAALAAAGYARVCAVDTSEVAIQRMRTSPPLPGLSYEVADVRHLAWPDGSMDALVDKATLDTALNGGAGDGEALLGESARTLRHGGVLLCVTTGAPEERLPLLLAPRAIVAAGAVQGGNQEAAPCFELAQHAELRRGVHTFHAYVLRRI